MAIQDGIENRIRANDVRTRMREYVQQKPDAPCVRALPRADRVGFDRNCAWITDARARLVAVAFSLGIFILRF